MNSALSDSMEGRSAELVVTDPWDLVSTEGGSRLPCVIVEIDVSQESDQALIRLREPIEWHGDRYEFLVLQNRHGKSLVDGLRERGTVHCNAVAVTRDKIGAGSPWGADRWRGGLGVIGDLVIQR